MHTAQDSPRTRSCTTLAAAGHSVTMLVERFVLSHLRYCVTVFGNASCETRDRIHKLVNFGAKVETSRNTRDHISDAVNQSLQWLSAAALYHYSSDPVQKCTANFFWRSYVPEVSTILNTLEISTITACYCSNLYVYVTDNKLFTNEWRKMQSSWLLTLGN